MKNLSKRVLNEEDFNTIIHGGIACPDYGTYTVGRSYIVVCEKTKREAKARCRQNCPYALSLVDDNLQYIN